MAVLLDWGNTGKRLLMPCHGRFGETRRWASRGGFEGGVDEIGHPFLLSLCSIIFGCRALEGVRVSKRRYPFHSPVLSDEGVSAGLVPAWFCPSRS